MEPRKNQEEYRKEDRIILDTLITQLSDQYGKVCSTVKKNAFSRSADKEINDAIEAFNNVYEKIVLAQTRNFDSISAINQYFNDFIATDEAIQSNATSKSLREFYTKFITVCRILLQLHYMAKQLHSALTNPLCVDLQIKTAESRGYATYQILARSPTAKVTTMHKLWYAKSDARTSADMAIKSASQAVATQDQAYNEKYKQLKSKIAEFESKHKKVEEEIKQKRAGLIARHQKLRENITAIVNKILPLQSIKDDYDKLASKKLPLKKIDEKYFSNSEVGAALTSAQFERDSLFSASNIENWQAEYTNCLSEAELIQAELKQLRKDSLQAKFKKDQDEDELSTNITQNIVAFTYAYDTIKADLITAAEALKTAHTSFFSAASEIESIIGSPKQAGSSFAKLASALNDFPKADNLHKCRDYVTRINLIATGMPNDEAKTSNEPEATLTTTSSQLQAACRAQTFNFVVFETDERRKWLTIGNEIEEALTTAQQALAPLLACLPFEGSSHGSPSLTHRFPHIFPLKKNNIFTDLTDRESEYNQILVGIDGYTTQLDSLLATNAHYQAEVETYRDAKIAELRNLKDQDLSKPSLDILHGDFVKEEVVAETQLKNAAEELNKARFAAQNLAATRDTLYQFIKTIEKEKSEYHLLSSTVDQDISQYEKQTCNDPKFITKLNLARENSTKAKAQYDAAEFKAAVETINVARKASTRMKEIFRAAEERRERETSEQDMGLVKTAYSALVRSKADYLGFKTDLEEIERLIDKHKKAPSSAQEAAAALKFVRSVETKAEDDLKRQAKTPARQSLSMQRHSTTPKLVAQKTVIEPKASSSGFWGSIGRFFVNNWKEILIASLVSLAIAATITALALSGVLTFGIVPAAVGGLVALGVSNSVAMGIVGSGFTLAGAIPATAFIVGAMKAVQHFCFKPSVAPQATVSAAPATGVGSTASTLAGLKGQAPAPSVAPVIRPLSQPKVEAKSATYPTPLTRLSKPRTTGTESDEKRFSAPRRGQ